MDETQQFILISLLLFVLASISIFISNKKKKNKNLPPSPPSLPVIGHLHLIKAPFHRALQQLSSEYGPVFALRFGSRPVLVVASPSAAEECFTKHDIILANRPKLRSRSYVNYNYTTIGSAPYGQLWRDLRRVSTLELLSTARLKAYMGVRHDEVRLLIKHLFQDASKGFTRVELKSRISCLTYNIILRTISGKRFYGMEVDDFKKASNFRDMIREVLDMNMIANPRDFIPFLRWIDFQGLDKKSFRMKVKREEFLQSLIDERRRKRQNSTSDGGDAKPVIDALLSLQESEPEYYTDDIIKGIILTMLLGGTDTTAVTIEWAMSLLLNHPKVIEKARAEVDECVGYERLADETDLPNLNYIQCIVNETLRLFPAAPLLVPHEPSGDFTVGGFNVSRGSIVLVNAWAIHRDPNLWDDPLTFSPERFTKFGNQGYKFLPFGMGRRQCPGSGFAQRVVGLALASLIQCFEWERVGQELVDLSEGKGITMPKLKPLEAMCRGRQRMIHVLRELSLDISKSSV